MAVGGVFKRFSVFVYEIITARVMNSAQLVINYFHQGSFESSGFTFDIRDLIC